MVIVLVLLSVLAAAGLTLYVYQQIRKRREQRIRRNENQAAATIRDYARAVKTLLEEAKKRGNATIDFQHLAIPKSDGYRLSIELSSYAFRIYGVPQHHNKTGRLSFFADGSLIVKAADKGGESADEKADAFNRVASEVLA